jgi:TetR/AcrR family transcriptional regulator
MNSLPNVIDRTRDPSRTRENILEIATREFADNGYSGARIDRIAERTQCTKRMIYYYFGGKEQLWIAVLDRAYSGIREAEQRLDVEGLEPEAAMRRLAELTYDHHTAHPDFLRLVSVENIHRGTHIAKSTALASTNRPVIELIDRILQRGREVGAFRSDIDALDVHMLISAYCVFPVANSHTFGVLFGRDLRDPARHAHQRQILGDMLSAYLTGTR